MKKLVILCVLVSLFAGLLASAAVTPSIEVRHVLDDKGALAPEPLLTIDDFASARVLPGENVVDVGLTRCGVRLFREATAHSVGRRMALLIDGKVVASPVVRAPIVSGHFNFSLDRAGDADQLAAMLNQRIAPRSVE